MRITIEQAEGIVGRMIPWRQLSGSPADVIEAADSVINAIRARFVEAYPDGNAGYYKTDVTIVYEVGERGPNGATQQEEFRLDVNENMHAPFANYFAAVRRRTRQDAIREACQIRELVYRSIGDYSRASDGFCDQCPAHDPRWNFTDEGQVTDYIRAAVMEKLKREGYAIAAGFDSVTGKVVRS